ncbi:MAG: mechanosensitive ion channel family protein [Bacteroidales bacterium]|nr:mechanosensitive ion channel family protein [Bacteroidales bacterium]MBR0299781.1 mechanosensitive ion channel family protein [Bacteroidales bacterium]
MKNRKIFGILVALFAVTVPALAVFTGMDLDMTLSNLRRELNHDYQLISNTQEQLQKKYETQHKRMVDIVKKCNDLSLMLYSQKQDYTFDISYALEKVSREFKDFNKNRTPYDRIVSNLNVEINRYARLIESLRRLPPELREVEVVPDSLAYHNDTLDAHLMQNESLLDQALQERLDDFVAMAAMQDTTGGGESVPAFILSEGGQADRDSCLLYASELLKMYALTRGQVMADSTHYREARLRMEESFEYARDYYNILAQKVFSEGQTPWPTILVHPREYWQEAVRTMGEKFNLSFLREALTEEDFAYSQEEISSDNQLVNSAKIYWLLVYFAAFLVLWGLSALLLLPLYRFVRPVGQRVAGEQRRYLALLLSCVLFVVLSFESTNDDMVRKGIVVMHTFIWLLMAITAALLVRVKPDRLKNSLRIYLPTVFTALFVITCRVLFVPNAFLNFFFPPLLLLMVLWQLSVNLLRSTKADKTDEVIAWVSLGVTAIAAAFACAGFIFLALIILVWWYFQLALILAIASIWDLTLLYKEKRLDKRIAAYKAEITYVTGAAKDKLLFSATWFYDLVREVLIPLLVLCSIPACIYWALDIFEFDDLYRTIFKEPFFRQGEFRVSLYDVLFLTGMFSIFRYANKAIHTLWQTFEYRRFLRKHNRKTVRSNEINLSLGNSLISVSVWFVYIDLFIVTLNIPTGSLGLIAGGLSAGIGLALKDILNNFIYGIQLMGGRLRVGDWIECDGVRGKVTDISYQTTLVETIDGTNVAFLNSSLFGKNFTNLTKNNAYELTTIVVGVAYGTDFQRVREALVKGLEPLKTKDAYGRDVVDPTYGIYIRFGGFGDSSVNVLVKQYVLQPERIGYVERCKELVYKTLNENGITIAFPQLDLHIIEDKTKG